MSKDKVLKNRKGEIVKREPPSLFCTGHRAWIETNEVHNLFSEVDGVKAKVLVWRCPACRGDAPPEAAVVARGPVTGADLSKDERLGPWRAVVGAIVLNGGGKSGVAQLACAHAACVAPKSKGVRCKKCRTGDSAKPRRGAGAKDARKGPSDTDVATAVKQLEAELRSPAFAKAFKS